MASTFDTIVIGSGHNGLVCGAYLARAGQSVLVLERREVVGGCAVTEEFSPGFRCSATFAGVETFDAGILADLDLGSFDLQIRSPTGILVPTSADEALYLPPMEKPEVSAWCEASQCSRADGEAFVEFDAFMRRLAEAFAPVLANPLPELDEPDLGDIFDLLRKGWLLRRLGTQEFRETMRFLPMPIADVVSERFQSNALKAAIGSGGITGSWLGPRSPGSALNLLFHRVGSCRGALGFPQVAVGGTGSLTDALRRAAEKAGAEIRISSAVERIVIADGKVQGVSLVDGSEIRCERVVSNADPKTTLRYLVGPQHLPPSVVRASQSMRSRGTVAIAKFALSGLPEIASVTDQKQLAGRVLFGSHLDELEQAFDATKYGEISERPHLDVMIPSLSDPGLAPEGKHVLSAWVQSPPYHLKRRGWHEAKDELTEIVCKRIEEFAPEFRRLILHADVLSPLDLETRFGVSEGCLYHLEPALDQALYLRPMPRWSGYRMPIENLYLCGSGAHGGGGLTGLAGRNAAQQVIADA